MIDNLETLGLVDSMSCLSTGKAETFNTSGFEKEWSRSHALPRLAPSKFCSCIMQVLNLMKGSDRMIKRTQPDVRTLPRRLCSGPNDSGTAVSGTDVETFDDSDFYQQLLKEFLEASTAADAILPSNDRRKKLKPARDRKGSKGRRLRYDVQVDLLLPQEHWAATYQWNH